LISDDVAQTLTPETAVAYLDGLEWNLYGGSYFDGTTGAAKRPNAMEPLAKARS
jgi:hypothetical protein